MTVKHIFEVGDPTSNTSASIFALNQETIQTAERVAAADGWVAVLEYPERERSTAATTAHRIKHGKSAAWNSVGTFDATVRKTGRGTVKIYARCITRWSDRDDPSIAPWDR